MSRLTLYLAIATLLIDAILVAIFAVMVIRFRAALQSEIHQKIIERDAAVPEEAEDAAAWFLRCSRAAHVFIVPWRRGGLERELRA